jgi:hypothetical protein
VQQHIEWNPATQLWETEQADLFSGQQEPFSETWPTSGMTRRGQLLPLETSAHRIGGSECSFLLPTPRSQNGEERNSNIWPRPLDQPQNLENALARVPLVMELM